MDWMEQLFQSLPPGAGQNSRGAGDDLDPLQGFFHRAKYRNPGVAFQTPVDFKHSGRPELDVAPWRAAYRRD